MYSPKKCFRQAFIVLLIYANVLKCIGLSIIFFPQTNVTETIHINSKINELNEMTARSEKLTTTFEKTTERPISEGEVRHMIKEALDAMYKNITR